MGALRRWRQGVRWDPEEHEATSDRLEKIVRATLKRNLERPAIDFEALDTKHYDAETTRMVGFVARQLQYIEDVGAQNLALLGRYQNVMSLRAAYAAQIQDERAHGLLLSRYAHALGAEPIARWQPVLGTAGGKLIQHDVWAGSVGVMTLVEFFASRLLEDLRVRIDEPVLREIFAHILVDEHRHRALAIEATRLMYTLGLSRAPLARARLRFAREAAKLFFVHMIAPMLDREAPALGIDGRALYEESYEEIERELAKAGAPV